MIRKNEAPASLNKGELEEATDGVDRLILRAFECPSLPAIVMTQEPPSSDKSADGEIDEQAQAADPLIVHARLTSLTLELRDQPSSLLADPAFVGSVKKCFDASDHKKETLGENDLQSSDELTGLLCSLLTLRSHQEENQRPEETLTLVSQVGGI